MAPVLLHSVVCGQKFKDVNSSPLQPVFFTSWYYLMSLTSWTWDRANPQQVNEQHAGDQGCLSEGPSEAEETGWQQWWLYTCNGHTGWGQLAMEQLCKKGSGFHADRLNKSAESKEGQHRAGLTLPTVQPAGEGKLLLSSPLWSCTEYP